MQTIADGLTPAHDLGVLPPTAQELRPLMRALVTETPTGGVGTTLAQAPSEPTAQRKTLYVNILGGAGFVAGMYWVGSRNPAKPATTAAAPQPVFAASGSGMNPAVAYAPDPR